MFVIEVSTDMEWRQQAQQASGDYLIFKHSTTCPISAKAYREVSEFAATNPLPVVLVKVIEARPLSLRIADELTIPHASPQVILMKGDRAVWNTSHYDITKEHMEAALNEQVQK